MELRINRVRINRARPVCIVSLKYTGFRLQRVRLQRAPGYNEQISLHEYRVATCQRNVREKLNFLQVREKSGNFEKMSGNFGHLTHVKELSGNFVMSSQGIVREFY